MNVNAGGLRSPGSFVEGKMKVNLLKPNKIDGNEGEIVEVNEDRAKFLLEFNLAEVYTEQKEEAPAEKPARRTRTKK